MIRWITVAVLQLCIVGQAAGQQCRLAEIVEIDLKSVLENRACNSHSIFREIDPLSRRMIIGATATQTVFNGTPRTAYKVENHIFFEANGLISEVLAKAKDSAPSGCSYARVGNPVWSTKDGRVDVQIPGRYVKRECMEGTCFVEMKWYGPKFKKCRWKVELGEVNFTVHASAQPILRADPDNNTTALEFETESRIVADDDLRGSFDNFLNVVTLGLSGSVIEKEIEKQVSRINAKLPKDRRHFANLPRIREYSPQVSFVLNDANFKNLPSSERVLSLAISQSTVQSKGVACSILNEANRAKQHARQCSTGRKTYMVKPGDSLWRIARREYGDGLYHALIKTPTSSTEDVIHPGDEIEIIPFYESMKANSHTVNYGDSLWNIAEKYYGDGRHYVRIAEQNDLALDDTLYPLMVLELP